MAGYQNRNRKRGLVPPPSAFTRLQRDTSGYPAIPDPTGDYEGLRNAVAALKSRALVQAGESGDYLDWFVRVRDLIALDLLNADGSQKRDNYVAWDDLRFPANGINPPGQASDPDVDSTTGLLLFDAATTETIIAFVQLPHAWLEGSYLVPHVHWEKTTSAVGDVAWQCRYKHSRLGEVRDAAWTDMGVHSTPVAGTPDNDTAQEHLLTSFGQLDMGGSSISDCLFFEISRVGGDASDTYGADALLLEFDVHYQIDAHGSVHQFIKRGQV